VKCKQCQVGEDILKRLGFKDTVRWAKIENSPNDTLHATYSNLSNFSKAESWKSICCAFGSEIAWVLASRNQRPLIYLAHPLSGQFASNVQIATQWVKWFRKRTVYELSTITGCFYQARPIVQAPWLGGVEPDGKFREAKILECMESVRIYDEVWVVGYFSEGVEAEARSAKVYRDLTWLGRKPPDGKKFSTLMKEKEREKANV